MSRGVSPCFLKQVLLQDTNAKMHSRKAITCFIFLLFVSSSTIVYAQDTPRSWQSYNASQIWTISEDDDFVLYRPTLLTLDDQGNVYVFDYGDMRVKSFNPDGTLAGKYGEGRGQGPGEFANPTDLKVDGDGNIWVADPVTSRVTVFNQDGSLQNTYSSDLPPYRIVITDGGYTILKQQPGDNSAFVSFDREGNEVLSFGKIVEDQAQNSVVVDGHLTASSDSLFFVPRYAGRLYALTPQGDELYTVDTIEPSDYPEVVVDERGGRRVDPEASPRMIGAHARESILYVSAIADPDGDSQGAIDVYDTRSGEYQYSMEYPSAARRLLVTSDRMYVITRDAELSAWDYEFSQ